MELNFRRFLHTLSEFRRSEDGVGGVFGIFFTVMILLIGGLAVDGTNVWRNLQLMKQTADVAAHSGVIQLAIANTNNDAQTAALGTVELNMPSAKFGNLFGNSDTDIQFVHYDSATNAILSGGPTNAVSVTLRRDELSANPLDTLLLGLADLLSLGAGDSLSEWNISATGVATFVQTKRCQSNNGLYAKEALKISSSNDFGAGYCLHSQQEVWMPQQNTFAPTTGISMPDVANCGSKCVDTANPGASDAAFETNLLLQDLNQHIQSTKSAFITPTFGDTRRDEFFSSKTVEQIDNGEISTLGLSPGAVVAISESDFESLTDIPRGLTYDVQCVDSGNGPSTRLSISSNGGLNPIEDVAIITNCSLDFGSDASVSSSLLLTTREASSATITSSQGGSVGTSAGGCDIDAHSYIMAMSDMSVPADFAGSNISILVDGNINFSASSSSSVIPHSGLSLHASGEISIAANHTFDSCNSPPGGMLPSLMVIRHVAPT